MSDKNENKFDLDSLNVFDKKEREVLLGYMKYANDRAESLAEDKVQEALEDKGLSAEDVNLGTKDRALMADQKRVQALKKVWLNNGYVDGAKDRLTLEDIEAKDRAYKSRMMADGFSTDHPLLIPRVISEIARDAIEPILNLTPLFQRVNFSAGTQIVFPAWGAIHAADIAEAGEYPERELELAGQVTATIGKSGVAVKMSEEMIRYSLFDMMSMIMRKAGQALARHKEQKCADIILAGDVVIDNSDTAIKSSTGRNVAGAYNGTLTLDDIHYAYGIMIDKGFTPNTLIMHPLAWQIFANDGISRAFGFQNGLAPLMWQLAAGQPGIANQWGVGSNKLNNLTTVTDPGQIATTHTNVPGLFPLGLRIIISPYMSFTAATNRTNMALCDVSELGVLVVDEDIVSDEWEDKARDIRKVKFRERYALADINEGKGIAMLNDIYVGEGNFDFMDKIHMSVDSLNITGGTTPMTGDRTYKGDA